MNAPSWVERARRINDLPEAERVEAIREYADEDSFAAAKALPLVSIGREGLRELTSFSLRRVDLQRMQYWIKGLVVKAGFRRVLRWIATDEGAPAEGLDFAAYHLRRLVPNTDRDRVAFAEFCQQVGSPSGFVE